MERGCTRTSISAGLLARALYKRHDRRAIGAINRALALNPGDAGLHLLAAGMLYDSQRQAQALVEYALALERAPSTEILRELVTRFPEPEMAVRGLPLAESSIHRIGNKIRNIGGPRLALRYGQRFAHRFPRSAEAQRYVADTARRLGHDELALEAARSAAKMDDGPASAITLSEALAASGQVDEASTTIRNAIEKPTRTLSNADRILLLRGLGRTEQRAGRADAARAAVHDALELADTDRRMAAALHRQLARIEAAVGNTHQAAWEQARAEDLTAPNQ